jgi:hypothetical protein
MLSHIEKKNVHTHLKQLHTTLAKQFSQSNTTHSTHASTRHNDVDICSSCGVDRIVDKELARATCPQCGVNKLFASHIFEHRENPPLETRRVSAKNDDTEFTHQYERGFPVTDPAIIEKIVSGYNKIHLHTPMKVNTASTLKIIKSVTGIPADYRSHADRITRELRRDNIHELTVVEAQEGRMAKPTKRSGVHTVTTRRTKRCTRSFTQLPLKGFTLARTAAPR